MKKILILLLSIVSFVGCSDVEGVIYDGGQSFVSFESTSYDLPVAVNSASTVDVKIVASTLSATERTYNLSVVEGESNANPLTYSIPSTITIPANSYFGVATITGEDNDLLDFVIKKLVIEVAGFSSAESSDTKKLTINIFEVCPLVIDDFVGYFDATTFWLGSTEHEVVEGSTDNTLQLLGFWEDNADLPNFVIKYDDDNNVTFLEQSTGYYYNDGTYQGMVYARMSPVVANVSKIDPCTNKMSIWVNYYIPAAGVGFGDKLEVFTKQ
jgi:hypothetical protein